jgi:dipeptidyl aminopeptidase/acylaminoacyl peptidase
MIKKVLSLLFLFSFGITIAQKKALTHDDYNLWKDISNTKISTNGKIIVATIKNNIGKGDGYLEIYNTETQTKATYFNGDKSSISYDEQFVIFKRAADYATKRAEKKKKIKEPKKEKDVLYIYDVKTNTLYDSITRVKSFKLPKKNSKYLVIEKFKNKKDSIKGDSLPAWKQNYGIVYHLQTKQQDTIFGIKDFVVPEEGNTFYYTKKSKKRKKKAKGVYAFNTATMTSNVIDTTRFDYKKLTVNKLGNQLGFLADRDSTETDSVPYKLFLYKNNSLQSLVANEAKRLGDMETLSGGKAPFFSDDGKRFYFYSKIKTLHKKDTTLLDEEIPEVDVWSWNDEISQPRQKVRSKDLKEDNRLFYYDVENDRYVKLQDDIIDEVQLNRKYATKYIVGIDNSPYAVETWKTPWERDYYLINHETGKKRLLKKQANSQMYMSQNGDYCFYFDLSTYDWISIDLETLTEKNLTKNIKVSFENEDNDIPAPAQHYGSGGFDKDGYLLLYDKYDVWKVAVNGSEKPKNITKKGRKKGIRFRTIRQVEDYRKAEYVNNQLFLTVFDENNKASGVYLLSDKGKLTEMFEPTSYRFTTMRKAPKADIFSFAKQSVSEYGDLYVTKDNFKTYTKITDVNPQQKDYKWGTSELVSWEAYDGTELEGLVYKPEDFDPSKKYPMIVYFYERSSDQLNRYFKPQPSASTVNRSYLMSNDYILFVPDIVYKTGQPGDDAYNCIMPGVEMMEKKGYIDSSRMALQGQSWGGYQVAYLITKTNKFSAAMAGAPVSNMTSAYGGIRWGSGLSRMFQYEKTQSRIGKNLWEGFDLYVKNSPLFSLPNVKTPLLIMHNDNDGAVPYYQGIELFMGMRRLKKPTWLLVYNNEAHNLRKMKNKIDLSIRMMQFFDHYLKDEAAPMWMTKGVPRSQKGVNFGYELDKQ